MTSPESSFRLLASRLMLRFQAKCKVLHIATGVTQLKVILWMSNFCECECNFTNQDQIKHFSCTTSCNSMFIMLVSYTSTLPAAASKLEGWRNREWVRPAPSIHEVWQTPCYLTLAPREFSNNFRPVITATINETESLTSVEKILNIPKKMQNHRVPSRILQNSLLSSLFFAS